MAFASILISAVSLFVSIAVAMLTLFRRGTLRLTHPVLIGFLYEGEQPKVFFRAMLYTTGKRGHIIEALYLRVQRAKTSQMFDFWMYGETKDLKIGSGLRVGEDGISFNDHFLPPKSETSFHLLPGEYVINIHARAVNRRKPVSLSTVALSLSQEQAAAVRDRTHWAVFTWKPNSKSYRCEISESRVPVSPLELPPLHFWER